MRERITGRFTAFADFELEAYLCDELDPATRARLERALETDHALREYLDERRRARAQFASQHPWRLEDALARSAAVAGPTDRRAMSDARAARAPRIGPGSGLGRLRWVAAAAAIAVPALAAALWWAGTASNPVTVQAPDTIRIKGSGLSAELYVKRGDQVFKHRPEQALRAGDQVRLSVDTPHAGYLYLIARDPRRHVATYYDRVALPAGRFTVPDSLQLDASSDDELWLVVVAPEPLPADDYARVFAAGGVPAAPHALIAVHKEKR